MKPRNPDQKTVTIGTKPASALWAEFIAEAKESAEVPSYEEGWRTPHQIAQECGLHRVTIDAKLRTLTELGKMERRAGRVNNRRAYYYRPKA